MKKLVVFLLAAGLHLPLFAAKQAQQNARPLKVLAIGNSFSEDAVEQYLYELAAAAGREIIIGNLYIGGGPIYFHADNIRENKHPYSYCKIESMYVKTFTEKATLAQGIADEDWDHISVQQVRLSSHSIHNNTKSKLQTSTYPCHAPAS